VALESRENNLTKFGPMKIVNSLGHSRPPKVGKISEIKTRGEPKLGARIFVCSDSSVFFNSASLAVLFFAVLSILALSFSSTAHAQLDEDPLKPKPNLLWLSDDVNVPVYGDNEYDSFLGKSEIWAKNWGFSAKLLQNDSDDVFGLPKDSKYFNFDIKRRVFGSQNKSNVELGLGWQEFDIDSQLEASGPKVSLNGRYNVLSG